MSLLPNLGLAASEETFAVKKVMPAVVHIGVSNEPSTEIHTTGSGVVITSRQGVTYVLTVKHNVVEADHLFIKTLKGKSYRVAYYVADAHKDLVILRIDTKRDILPTAEIGNSRNLEVGQTIFVLGFPIPFLVNDDFPSISRGVVSALNRTLIISTDRDEALGEESVSTLAWKINHADGSKKGNVYEFSTTPLIQIDAMINFGSSGGPLITTDGKVVGVIHSMITTTDANAGMNFVIPISEAEILLTIAGVKETK